MYPKLLRQGAEAEKVSELWLLSKIASLAKIIGPRASEYAQKTQSKVEVHKYTSYWVKQLSKTLYRKILSSLAKVP